MSMLFSNNGSINNAIRNYLNSKLSPLGMFKYSYMVMNKRNPLETLIISNYPKAWVDIYCANHYQQIDPVVLNALNRISPFSWNDSISRNSMKHLSDIFKMARNYNIINGYTFVLHDHDNNLAMLSIVMDDANFMALDETIEQKKSELQLLLVTVHDKIISRYREIKGKLHHHLLNNKAIFSERENEILHWASMGKTYAEISLILEIKVGTVKFHMGNVVKKLGVLNAKHAIRLSIELQLIF